MHFGKRKKSTDPRRPTVSEALRTVHQSAQMAQTAGDYKRAVGTWTAVLLPSFGALDVKPPYFQNLFVRLEELTKKEGETAALARAALGETRKAERHLASLRDKKTPRRRTKKAGHGDEKYAEDARLAKAMVDGALAEQLAALEREAQGAASAGKLALAQELRERKLVYQHEQDVRRRTKRRDKAEAEGSKAPRKKRAAPKTAKRPAAPAPAAPKRKPAGGKAKAL